MATVVGSLKVDVKNINDCLPNNDAILRVLDGCVAIINKELNKSIVIDIDTEYSDIDPILYQAIVIYFQWYCCKQNMHSNVGLGSYSDGYNKVDKKGTGSEYIDVCGNIKLQFDDMIDQLRDECSQGIYFGTSLVE